MTIRLDERDYAELKGEAAREAAGHWRCVWWFSPRGRDVIDRDFAGELSEIAPNEWVVHDERFETEAAADEAGHAYEQKYWLIVGVGGARYVRAEFFPDYSGGA